MAHTRLAVRAAMWNMLAGGFNSTYAAAREAHIAQAATWGFPVGDIPALELDWSVQGSDVFSGYLSPEDLGGKLDTSPAGVQLYTSTSQAPGPESVKFGKWSGEIIGNIDFLLAFLHRQDMQWSADLANRTAEDVADVIEAALIEQTALFADQWATYGVSYSGNLLVQRQQLQPLEDGWQQVIPFQMIFDIDV